MNVDAQRRFDRYVGVPLCRALSLLPRARDRASDAPLPKKILVILLSEMGSLFLARPMLLRLREKYPEAALVRELMVLFHLADLLVTNDGGPGHFAAMTPVPSIILYGPETPVLYGSLQDEVHHFYLNLSCSPCVTAYNHRASPCDGDNQCLKRITPAEVIRKAKELTSSNHVGV